MNDSGYLLSREDPANIRCTSRDHKGSVNAAYVLGNRKYQLIGEQTLADSDEDGESKSLEEDDDGRKG